MRPIGAILASVALLQLGSGLLNTLLAVTANEQGFSTARIGVIMSGFFRGVRLRHLYQWPFDPPHGPYPYLCFLRGGVRVHRAAALPVG